ncbi:PLAC8-domain-containing protein, partial [Cristinia sonorae]
MSSSGGNKNAMSKPFDRNGSRPWSHGLFSCFGDCSTCLTAWCCPCIVWGQNKTRLEHLERTGQPHPDGGESCGSDCMLHLLLDVCGGWGWVLAVVSRGDSRERYSIEGNAFKDFFAAWCCHACELTQESREIELEEQSL